MPRRPGQSTLPPPLEMSCLSTLWALHEANVRQVADALAPRHNLAYTTVMTLLDRLVRRGHLTRRKVGRSFLFTPAQDPRVLRESAINELANLYFAGSRDDLRQWLIGGAIPPAAPAEPNLEPLDATLL